MHSGSPCLGALAGQLLCEGFAVNPFLSQVIALTYADIGRECSLAGHPPDFPVGWLPGRKRSCIWSVISGSPFQISSLTTHLRFEGADTSSRTHPDRVLLLSRMCAKVRTVLFLPRRVLLTIVVSDRRDFPDYGGGHPRRSAAITGRTRHG